MQVRMRPGTVSGFPPTGGAHLTHTLPELQLPCLWGWGSLCFVKRRILPDSHTQLPTYSSTDIRNPVSNLRPLHLSRTPPPGCCKPLWAAENCSGYPFMACLRGCCPFAPLVPIWLFIVHLGSLLCTPPGPGPMLKLGVGDEGCDLLLGPHGLVCTA